MKKLWGLITFFCAFSNLNGMQQISKRFNAVAPIAYGSLIGRYYSIQPAPTFKSLAKPAIFDTTILSSSVCPVKTRHFSTYFSWKNVFFGPPFSIDLEKGRINFNYHQDEIKYFYNQIIDAFIESFDQAYKSNDLNTIKALLNCMATDTKSIYCYPKNGSRDYTITFPSHKQSAIINYTFCAIQNKNYALLKLFVKASSGSHALSIDYEHNGSSMTLFTLALINKDIKAIKILLESYIHNLFILKYPGGLSAKEALFKMIDENSPLLNHLFVSELHNELATAFRPMIYYPFMDYETHLKIRKYLGFEEKPKDRQKEKSGSGADKKSSQKKDTAPSRFESTDPYIIFDIPKTPYTKAEINAFYRKLAKEFHPDSNNSDNTEIMQKINEARDKLLAKCKS